LLEKQRVLHRENSQFIIGCWHRSAGNRYYEIVKKLKKLRSYEVKKLKEDMPLSAAKIKDECLIFRSEGVKECRSFSPTLNNTSDVCFLF